MKVGGLIVAAGLSSRMNGFKPMMEIGKQSIIKRVIVSFKEAGVDPIVVITGFKADQLEVHLEDMDVNCIRNTEYDTTEMFDSVKIGLNYLKDQCEKVCFTPGDMPLFSSQSIISLLESKEKLAKPTYNGRGGHPLMIDCSLINTILTCKTNSGLKGAIRATGLPVKGIEVPDKGILLDADTREDYEKLRKFYNKG